MDRKGESDAFGAGSSGAAKREILTRVERLLVAATLLVLAMVIGVFLLARSSAPPVTGGTAGQSALLVGDAALAAALNEPVEAGRVPFIMSLPLAQAKARLRLAGFQDVVVANAKSATGDRVMDVEPQVGTYGNPELKVAVYLEEDPVAPDDCVAGYCGP